MLSDVSNMIGGETAVRYVHKFEHIFLIPPSSNSVLALECDLGVRVDWDIFADHYALRLIVSHIGEETAASRRFEVQVSVMRWSCRGDM